jgi:hypothetical protein
MAYADLPPVNPQCSARHGQFAQVEPRTIASDLATHHDQASVGRANVAERRQAFHPLKKLANSFMW